MDAHAQLNSRRSPQSRNAAPLRLRGRGAARTRTAIMSTAASTCALGKPLPLLSARRRRNERSGCRGFAAHPDLCVCVCYLQSSNCRIRISALGHSRPMHSVPVPINVRCYSNSDIIIRRSEVTLRASKRLMHRSKIGWFEIGCQACSSSSSDLASFRSSVSKPSMNQP